MKHFKIVVAKKTEEHIKQSYPHLTSADVEYLFRVGKWAEAKEEHKEYKKYRITTVTIIPRLQIPNDVQKKLSVGEFIDVITDDDGIVCKKW